MNIYCRDKNLILEDVSDFDIEDTLECGQCFHFTKLGDKEYELIAFGRYLHIKQYKKAEDSENNCFILYDIGEEDFSLWRSYFDLDTDYRAIKEAIIKADRRLGEVIENNSGIRILKQDFFETLISFIISQNKQIPHIKQIVFMLSEKYGRSIKLHNGKTVYAFPTVEELYAVSEDELRLCKVGFRAPYIRQATEKVYDGSISEKQLRGTSYNEAKSILTSIKGVGEKVANCVLLFGLSFSNAFPVDVWMKRIMEEMYFKQDTKKEIIEAYAYELFGEYSGYAQQYLFTYGRKIGVGK